MSSPKTHVIQSILSSALLYPVAGVKVIPFGLAVILIDLDHYLQYIWDTGDYSFRGFWVYFDLLTNNLCENYLGLNIFHTVEFYGLLLLLGNKFAFCYYILTGFLFHHLFDLWSLNKRGLLFARAFSIIEYFIKRKKGKYILSLKDVLRKSNLNLEEAVHWKKWLIKWGINLGTVPGKQER